MTSIYDFYETRFGVIPTMLALRAGWGRGVRSARQHGCRTPHWRHADPGRRKGV